MSNTTLKNKKNGNTFKRLQRMAAIAAIGIVPAKAQQVPAPTAQSPPQILNSNQPSSYFNTEGNFPTQLSVNVAGQGPFTFEWQKDGQDVPSVDQVSTSQGYGSTVSTLSIPNYNTGATGFYNCIVTNSAGSVYSAETAVYVLPLLGTSDSKLVNISSLGQVGPGSPMTAGFTLSQQVNQYNSLLIRGVGPTLKTFGVGNAIALPNLQMYGFGGPVPTTNAWGGSLTPTITQVTQEVGAFPLTVGSSDAAILWGFESITTNPTFTVQLTNKANSAGMALLEIYDATAFANVPLPNQGHVTNLSTLAQIGNVSNNLTLGFVVEGNSPKTFLIQAIGPSLQNFGVANPLQDPILYISSGQSNITFDWGWSNAPEAAEIEYDSQLVGATAMVLRNGDSADVVTLPPGEYTAQVYSASGASGSVLLALYEVNRQQ